MEAEKIELSSAAEATEAIDKLGSDNSRLMATRALHVNVLVKQVPGADARLLKSVYNDIGAEAAISRHAYREEEGAVTDMIVMGTLYQHCEVRRVLKGNAVIKPLLDAIEAVVEGVKGTQR